MSRATLSSADLCATAHPLRTLGSAARRGRQRFRNGALAVAAVSTLNKGVAAHDELRKDLEATVEARRELGPEFEPELVASFLDRLEGDLNDRLKTLSESRVSTAQRRDTGLPLAVWSLALGIPISGVAGGTGDLPGLITAWAGIAIINIAHAWSNRR